VFPTLSSDNKTDHPLAHSESRPKLLLREISGSIQATNFSHNILGQLSLMVRRPNGHNVFAVAYRVKLIVGVRTPCEIFHPVIQLVVVQVPDYGVGRTLWWEKSLCYQVVDETIGLFSVKT
jgi:hypothetical protein